MKTPANGCPELTARQRRSLAFMDRQARGVVLAHNEVRGSSQPLDLAGIEDAERIGGLSDFGYPSRLGK